MADKNWNSTGLLYRCSYKALPLPYYLWNCYFWLRTSNCCYIRRHQDSFPVFISWLCSTLKLYHLISLLCVCLMLTVQLSYTFFLRLLWACCTCIMLVSYRIHSTSNCWISRRFYTAYHPIQRVLKTFLAPAFGNCWYITSYRAYTHPPLRISL
jgi:hypothetical protein